MNQTKETSGTQLTELLGMTNNELDEWKEEVQMDAIKLHHHAHVWTSEKTYMTNNF